MTSNEATAIPVFISYRDYRELVDSFEMMEFCPASLTIMYKYYCRNFQEFDLWNPAGDFEEVPNECRWEYEDLERNGDVEIYDVDDKVFLVKEL